MKLIFINKAFFGLKKYILLKFNTLPIFLLENNTKKLRIPKFIQNQ
jgi:hypothetical protein